MDGCGRFFDNIFAFSGGREARERIGDWMHFYNHRRPHTAYRVETPIRVYPEKLSASGPDSRPDLHSTAKAE